MVSSSSIVYFCTLQEKCNYLRILGIVVNSAIRSCFVRRKLNGTAGSKQTQTKPIITILSYHYYQPMSQSVIRIAYKLKSCCMHSNLSLCIMCILLCINIIILCIIVISVYAYLMMVMCICIDNVLCRISSTPLANSKEQTFVNFCCV